jgi:hypothetical protein
MVVTSNLAGCCTRQATPKALLVIRITIGIYKCETLFLLVNVIPKSRGKTFGKGIWNKNWGY